MKEWVKLRNISSTESMLKFELFDLIMANKPSSKNIYLINYWWVKDMMSLDWPHMYELNIIDLVSAQKKTEVRELNIERDFSFIK